MTLGRILSAVVGAVVGALMIGGWRRGRAAPALGVMSARTAGDR
jgi:hypothetical protein